MRSEHRRTRGLVGLLCTLAALLLAAGCSAVDGLVLVVTAAPEQPVLSYVVKVQDRATRKLVLHSGAQRLPKARNLADEPLRIALPAQRGTFLVQVLAANYESVEQLPRPGINEPQLFFAGIFEIGEVQEVSAELLPIPPSMDRDRDHFPDALPWMASLPEAAARYTDHPELLDCIDSDPPSGDLLPLRTRAFDIHPLAPILCGVQLRPPKSPGSMEQGPHTPFDVSCSGMPRTCTDQDGDGEPEGRDCDDNDARRFHGNPRPRNCCQCKDRKECQTNHEKLGDLLTCQPKRCDTTFDFDCSGLPVECFTDEDCDGYAPDDPIPSQRDCDDHDPRVHPGAKKICDPADEDLNKDWACDGNPQGGCVACDLDGDGFQRTDAANGCPTSRYIRQYGANPPIDCDDDDRGVFPGAAAYQSTSQILRDLNPNSRGGSVVAAMRGLCRNLNVQNQPQDTSCDGNARLGCPATACDQDGDGFASGAVGCAPADPKQIDCNDSDPTAFPGAPRYCKDNKDHDCDSVIDTCVSDRDGDGFDSRYDCDDSNAKVRPFTTDSCNGIDDDCDGVIDELNPDVMGNRLIETQTVAGTTYRMTTSCADSTIGECGAKTPRGGYTGRCVCSGTQPKPDVPAAQRVLLCPGQKDDATLNPKCFGATQPGLQTCDADSPRDEDCDGRNDAPDGKNLAEFGQKCGVTIGQCRASKVVGCDRRKLNPFSANPTVRPMSAQGPVPGFSESSRFLVCDANGLSAPINEQCNGYDDDCDGVLPGVGAPDNKAEIDLDGDKYLRCNGCKDVYNASSFNPAFRACDDCDDRPGTGTAFYPSIPGANMGDPPVPGATELCDGVSNQCLPSGVFDPARDDGREQCGAGMNMDKATCCPQIPMCIDAQSNFDYCGSCNNRCSSSSADRCAAGKCKCNNDPACDPMSADKPLCKAGAGCVQCISAANCQNAAMPICHSTLARCVECEKKADCLVSGKPLCDAASSRCVACLNNTDCGPLTPVCNKDPGGDATKNSCGVCTKDADCAGGQVCIVNANMALNRCSECSKDADCKDMTKPACSVDAGGDVSKNRCVPCLKSADCKDMAKPACAIKLDPTMNQCVACVTSMDCKDMTKPVCAVDPDPSKSKCVECVANTDCKDPMKPTCTMNACQ